jgi:hypothetical protein
MFAFTHSKMTITLSNADKDFALNRIAEAHAIRCECLPPGIRQEVATIPPPGDVFLQVRKFRNPHSQSESSNFLADMN